MSHVLPCSARKLAELRERRRARSLLSALLGGNGLGRGRGGSGRLNLDAHSEVLSCDSLFLAHVVFLSSGLSLSLEVLLTDDLSL